MSADASNIPAGRSTSQVVELRQYTHYPGARETMIDLFERIFIAEQERAGMETLDQFRDLDDPDRFVWMRGFPDMPERAAASNAFYGGEIWQRTRDAANATMIDRENVLLLRPVDPFRYPVAGERPPAGTATDDGPLVALTVCSLDPAQEAEFPAFFQKQVAPVLTNAGADVLAAFASEHSPNNYPRLAIREGESVFIWFLRCPDQAAYERHLTALEHSAHWTNEFAPSLANHLAGEPLTTRLTPTSASRLRA